MIMNRLQQEKVEHMHFVVRTSMSTDLWQQLVVFDTRNSSIRTMLFYLRHNIIQMIDYNET